MSDESSARAQRAEVRVKELEAALQQIREHEEARPVEYQSMHALFVIDEVLGEARPNESGGDT